MWRVLCSSPNPELWLTSSTQLAAAGHSENTRHLGSTRCPFRGGGGVSIGLQMGDGAGFRTGGFRINGLVQGRRSWVEI